MAQPSNGVAGRRFAAGLLVPLLAAGVLAVSAAAPGPAVRVTIADEQAQVELVELPIDPRPRIQYEFTPNMRFGFMIETDQGFRNITCASNGSTNNTYCRIDDQDIEFGNPQGKWDPQQAPLNQGQNGRKRQGTRSTWIYNNIHVTQLLEIVPSTQPAKTGAGVARRPCDTCLIRYVIENKDAQAHKVGIRNMIDTLIVDNDGALFALPESKEVVNGGDYHAKEVPAYARVLQRPDLQNPGTVAYITLKVGGRLEAPGRLTLTRWPGSGVGWEVPVGPAVGDSAYAVYWSPQELKPGGKREVGFAFGRGIAGGVEDEGKVAVALGGSFEPHKLFTVTAYVENPVDGQNLTLELPAGMACVEGRAIQPVPPPTEGGLSLVLWKAKVLHMGEFPLKVRSSTGVTLTKTISITPADAPPLVKPKTGRAEPKALLSPIGAAVNSQGRQPLVSGRLPLRSPEGAEVSAALSGLSCCDPSSPGAGAPGY